MVQHYFPYESVRLLTTSPAGLFIIKKIFLIKINLVIFIFFLI